MANNDALILTDKIKEKSKSLSEEANLLMKSIKEKEDELNRLRIENKELKEKIKEQNSYQ